MRNRPALRLSGPDAGYRLPDLIHKAVFRFPVLKMERPRAVRRIKIRLRRVMGMRDHDFSPIPIYDCPFFQRRVKAGRQGSAQLRILKQHMIRHIHTGRPPDSGRLQAVFLPQQEPGDLIGINGDVKSRSTAQLRVPVTVPRVRRRDKADVDLREGGFSHISRSNPFPGLLHRGKEPAPEGLHHENPFLFRAREHLLRLRAVQKRRLFHQHRDSMLQAEHGKGVMGVRRRRDIDAVRALLYQHLLIASIRALYAVCGRPPARLFLRFAGGSRHLIPGQTGRFAEFLRDISRSHDGKAKVFHDYRFLLPRSLLSFRNIHAGPDSPEGSRDNLKDPGTIPKHSRDGHSNGNRTPHSSLRESISSITRSVSAWGISSHSSFPSERARMQASTSYS